ncbi:MAG: hypothetical protein GTO45_23200 [Candidatus Aminicenantes bacterium]|nr:hypothetical protein [Candidatus Aminicenantes bacterium]NIN21035.1 hypothetical protein [Candidatus Aminicenantes bacterium]NIN44857.1 hypothetical protein [Candidatus Aminicenantes bacterium]NIN87671.1 hypothetical protein [Candidatus Aminicenantes bacterium]NIO83956.1 hypothetical protein [Candidatus Aminicenantes bacterium]
MWLAAYGWSLTITHQRSSAVQTLSRIPLEIVLHRLEMALQHLEIVLQHLEMVPQHLEIVLHRLEGVSALPPQAFICPKDAFPYPHYSNTPSPQKKFFFFKKNKTFFKKISYK